MSLTLKFDVKDDASASIKKLQSQLNQLNPTIKNTTTATGAMNSSMIGTIATVSAFVISAKALSSAFNSVVTNGLAFNKSLESARAGIIALSVATQNSAIPVQERYIKAQQESLATLKELQKINVQTPHTLEQTNKIYKAMYVSMKAAGASTSDMIELTRSISIASGAAGIEFNSLLAGVDGLASGTVLANSDLGRFLSSLGLTNDVLKKSDDVVKLVTERLKDFKALGTITEATSNFDNAWSNLTGKMTEGTFDGAKYGLNELSSLINSISDDDIKQLQKGMNEFGIVALNVVYGVAVGAIKLANTFDTLGASIAEVAFRVESGIFLDDAETKALDAMWKSTVKNIDARNNFIDVLDKSKKAMEDSINTTKEAPNSGGFDLGAKSRKTTSTEQLNEQIKATEKLRKEQEKLSEENQKVRESFISLTGTEYDAWLVDANNKMIELSKNGVLSAEELAQAWDNLELTAPDISEFDAHVKMFYENQKTLQEQATALMTSDIDKINAKYLEMYDAVQGIFDDEQMQKFFSTWNKEISKATKEQKSYEGIGSDEWTQGLRGQAKDLSNVGKAFKSISKEQEEFNKYSKENNVTEKDKGKHLENQISLFGNLAGAMSNLAEDGSQSAKVLQTAQAALSLTSLALGVAEQSKLPFPYNIAAMASTLATGISILSSLGVSGGGGGGSSSPDYAAIEKQNVENRQTDLENQYEPLLEKFDTQISLLEKIEKNGSASKYSISQARTQYEYDISTYANQIGDVVGGYREVDYSKNNYTAMINTANAFLDFSKSIKKFGIDATGIVASLHYAHKTVGYNLSTVLNTKSDLLSYVANRNEIERLYDVARTKISTEVNAPKADIATNAEFEKIKIEVGTFIGDFALAIGDSIEQMKDMSLEFQDIFDSLTNTMTYSNKRLSEAQKEVSALLKGRDLESYLKTQISLISEVEKKYGMTIDKFLASNDLAIQAAAVIEMERITGIAFEGGTEAALNYLDSIKLVSEAMINSNENIKSYKDSFKTDEQLAKDLATTLGVRLAGSFIELDNLFNRLSKSGGLLTDAELELLNANKALIEDNQKLIDDAVLNFSNNMKSMADSIDSAINTIKGGMLSGDELTTDQIRRLNYTQMAFESALSGGDSDKARELLSEITSLSTGISSGAFGDTSKINANLVSSLEANKAMIDFTDEVLMVRIVASDLDYEQTVATTTPSVYVTNSTNNDDRLATLEAIMIEVLKTNNNVYDVLLRIQNDGLKAL